jgi:streptomycin 6-kinase
MNLPDDFIQTMQNVFQKDGERFIESLPKLIDEVSARWNLAEVQPVSNLSFNFVAFAKRQNEDVILKIGVPRDELTSETAALKLFNGDGACQLLESDEEKGFLLLERLKPGMMLSDLENDDERTHIAADVIVNIHSRGGFAQPSASTDGKLIKLSDWFNGLNKIRPHYDGGTGPFPRDLLEMVESFLPELFADEDIKLLHGDFHHFNILSSERGWLIIDPKGVIGPAGYEIGPFMLNPWSSVSDESQFRVQAERRISIFSERLGWKKEKIIKWSMAHAVLSAWWSIEDGMEEEYALQCARMFSELK